MIEDLRHSDIPVCARPAASPAQRRARLRASGKIVAWRPVDRPAWLAWQLTSPCRRTPIMLVTIDATMDLASLARLGRRSEKELIQAFVNKIAEFNPQLVTFNGNSFDLPVLRYRAMTQQHRSARFICSPLLQSIH